MTYYALHSDRRLASPLSIPPDYATNNAYAWYAFDSADHCAQWVAVTTAHRVAVATHAVPSHVVTSAHARPLPPTGYIDTRAPTCHNAQHGSYNHECGKPATYLGTKAESGFQSNFCDWCAKHGDERHGYTMQRIT